ncbi:uncharacterized protein BX664DRAFT_318740 [Halteromyces radiatus]|uniref:uncharacterized protein n=1 Tax=Halteromyces radiatus TaxID=101107 RepID=UPI00221F66C1|nr:uncharacterized protein BX664DRAFT_318740 [Halteromyces radiatus]KAI8098451.1 hypothetical protein BX664DRAFT_318740 [Halteromyces radiatus]
MPVPFFSGGRQLSIELAEPVVILRGHATDPTTAVVRGEVELLLSKPILASSVVVKLVGKSHMLWPEGLGPRNNKLYHEKTIHEQNIILQSFPEDSDRTLPAGLHRWPFEFLLPNRLVETIEDELAKVYYYVSSTVTRIGMGTVNLRCRRQILLLRALSWSDQALTSHSLSNPSILVERRFPQYDATIFIEKSMASSGTQFPITLILSPHRKHVHLESVSVLLTERRVYQLPEFDARRGEMHDYKLPLNSAQNMADTSISSFAPPNDIDSVNLRRALTTKNAHIPLTATPFQYRFVFTLPNCINLNHTTTYNEMHFSHFLKINIELTFPQEREQDQDNDNTTITVEDSSKGILRTSVHLDTPITILDCRLKDDHATLPSYEAARHDSTVDSDDLDDPTKRPTGFFLCPCYLEYKKECKQLPRPEWMMVRQNITTPPPPYSSKC